MKNASGIEAGHDAMPLMVQCVKGLEGVTERECRDKILSSQMLFKDHGILIVKSPWPAEPFRSLRSAYRVSLHLGSAERGDDHNGDASNVIGVLEGVDLLSASAEIHPSRTIGSFSLKIDLPEKELNLYYTLLSKTSNYVSRKYGWMADRKGKVPVLIIVVTKRRLHMGIEVFPPEVYKRAYRRQLLPFSLDPAAAYCMVSLSNPEEDDAFLDAMCGSATIPIERALYGPACRIIGGDISPKSLKAAKSNVASAGITIELREWDARKLPLPDESVTRIVTNLPWGIRRGKHESNRKLYVDFSRQVARLLKNGGRTVLLSQEKRLFRESFGSLQGIELEREVEVSLGGLSPNVFILVKR
jgi:23S rRNA G2445 N2-methylase RlmL